MASILLQVVRLSWEIKMRIPLYSLSVVTALIALSPPSQAAPIFTGSAVGAWGATTGGVDNPHPDVTESNRDGAATGSAASKIATLSFGSVTPNIFTFDGAGSNVGSAVGAFSAAAGTLFDIGRFTYKNGNNTTIGTSIDAVSLGITLTLTSPLSNTSNYSYNFGIDITPNNTGNPVTDGDIVTISNGISSSTFSYNGINYTLALEGFSTNGGHTFTSQFLSPEGSTATADIYAVINQPSLIAVPEPLSVALFGSGLIALTMVKRRRKS
jgi:hypothetical protein